MHTSQKLWVDIDVKCPHLNSLIFGGGGWEGQFGRPLHPVLEINALLTVDELQHGGNC